MNTVPSGLAKPFRFIPDCPLDKAKLLVITNVFGSAANIGLFLLKWEQPSNPSDISLTGEGKLPEMHMPATTQA